MAPSATQIDPPKIRAAPCLDRARCDQRTHALHQIRLRDVEIWTTVRAYSHTKPSCLLDQRAGEATAAVDHKDGFVLAPSAVINP
jgi:hypothetical protein